MTPTRTAAALAALSLLAPSIGPAAAQAPQRPVYSADVSLVLLPIFVADGDGRAMRGLRPEDFEVQEDGKKVEVVSFRYVDTTSPEDQEELRQSPPARRRFLLLFDKSFTDPGGLARAQRAASEFVRLRLAPSDLAAVATIDVHRGVRVIANFTEDRHLLSHAVMTLGVTNIARISDPLALAADLNVTDIALPGASEDAANAQGVLNNVMAAIVRRMRAAEDQAYRAQVLSHLGSLQDLARALRTVEGRKQVLYFSAGFDSRVLIGETGRGQKEAAESIAMGSLWEVDGLNRYGDMRVRDLLQQATRGLSSADTVVHSIDVTGMGTDSSLQNMQSTEELQRSVPGRESLNVISSDTGGRFFKDTNDLSAVLNEMADMTSRYYVLGFQPAKEKGPGEFHKVKVKVARKGARVSHRAGYYERLPLSAQPALQRQFEAAQLVMTGVGQNDLAFSSLCLPFPRSDGKQDLGIVLEVAKEALPWAARRPLAVEVYGYGVAADGTVIDHFAQLVRVDPSQADPDGTVRGLSLMGTLTVPPGRYTVRLLMHERESGAAGVQLLEVNVPPPDPSRGFLLPPLVVDDSGLWLSMQMGGRAAGQGPFALEGAPFVPRARFTARPGEQQKLVLIAFEPDVAGDPAADVQIRSSLTDGRGQTVAPGLLRLMKVLHDGKGRRTYVLRYTPEVSQPGDYTLRVGVGEAGARLESYSLLKLERTGS
ncbi:MAG TPA: VWA domain-containing protein [Vicinamibacteria bacterium]|nr:VWA domain-containing protein [Vicinamibacteria bacterium]